MLLIGPILFGCVLQQHRHQPFPGARARRFDLVLLKPPQTEVALEIGFGHTRHEHLGLANRPRQLGPPLLPGPQIMTIKEHLEPVIKNLPGLPAQRLHQLLHPPHDIIPTGITHKHRIPTRRCGVLWPRWRHRHDILPRIAEQPLRTLLTDRTADGPGQVGPTRGSGPSTGRQNWFRHGPLLRRSPAQPTSGRGCSRPGSTNFKKTTLFLRHETRKKNGSMSCGDVEPSNLRDSCTKGKGAG